MIASETSVSSKTITHDSVSDMQWAYDYGVGDRTIVTNPDAGQTTYFLQSLWGESLVTSIVEPRGSIRTRQWAQNSP